MQKQSELHECVMDCGIAIQGTPIIVIKQEQKKFISYHF